MSRVTKLTTRTHYRNNNIVKMEKKENIREAIKKVSTEDLLKTCRFYLETKDLQDKTKVSNDIFDQFLEYFSVLEGKNIPGIYPGWSAYRHTYQFLLDAFFVRMNEIIVKNTYDHNQMDGIKILSDLGLNNLFNYIEY